MDIDIKQVQKLCTSTTMIEQETNVLLKTIKSSILEASKDGRTRVTVPIPTNFSTTGMSNKATQTIIYHKLIKAIERQGFTVEIEMSTTSDDYTVIWSVDYDNSDMANMRKVIAAHSRKESSKESPK